MARNDDIIKKDDPQDIKLYDGLIKKAFLAKRKIETGFIELAESIFEIHQKKLYKIKYRTFGLFCDEELGFSRQTIYVYISILKLIKHFPDQFPREIAIEFGHKKMRHISEGFNAIDKIIHNEAERTNCKMEIINSISPEMPSTEIESRIEELIDEF